MKAIFKPTNYEFTFDDEFFVQIKYAGAFASGGTPFVAAFKHAQDAIDFAKLKMRDNEIAAAWVFTRERQVEAFYS